MIARLARGLAILLALLAAADPAITTRRRTRPEIAVVAADPAADSALAARVAAELSASYQVLNAPFTGAAATVVVGDGLPSFASDLALPGFAVIPERSGPQVELTGITAPGRAPVQARVPVAVQAQVTGARGGRVTVTLRAGELVVDRVVHDITDDDATLQVPLAFVPTATGAVVLRISAELERGRPSASADFVVDIREQPWAVLFFDPRPSWMSTFVRRAVERDPRFVVTSRVVTSRDVSTDAGGPPASLDDPALLEPFDVIVVGAPEALNDRAVDGLETFLRRRAGGVVLLLDQRTRGAWERLSGAGPWSVATSPSGIRIAPAAPDSRGLTASDIAWPDPLPADAEPLAFSRPTQGQTQGRPVIWETAVGAGRLVTSGALDAWQFRDAAMSAFDTFWPALIARTADAAPPRIDVRIATAVAAPGESVPLFVTLRRPALADLATPVSAGVRALLETPGGSTPLRLWPDGPPGRFSGALRAPATPGTYRVVVESDGARADVPLVVRAGISRISLPEHDVLRAWTSAGGGLTLSASRLHELPAALTLAVPPALRRETWYPMRSAWWILPFALLLGADWLIRRRRGLA